MYLYQIIKGGVKMSELTISRDKFQWIPHFYRWKYFEERDAWLEYCGCTWYISLSWLWFELELWGGDINKHEDNKRPD